MPRDLTTKDVARICGFSQQTAIRCIDAGLMKGSYYVPYSKFRRVPRGCLNKFMEDNGIPGNGEQLFSTGEVARICRISQQKIIKCFDEKKLGGFRIPVRARFRLIPRSDLEKFMRDYGIPMDELPPAKELCSEEKADGAAEHLVLGA